MKSIIIGHQLPICEEKGIHGLEHFGKGLSSGIFFPEIKCAFFSIVNPRDIVNLNISKLNKKVYYYHYYYQ